MIKLIDILKEEINIQYPKGYKPPVRKSSVHVEVPPPRVSGEEDINGFKLSNLEKDPITGREMQSVEYESSLSIMRKTLNKYHNSLKHIKQSKNQDIAKQASQLSTMLKAASEKIKTLDILIKTYNGK